MFIKISSISFTEFIRYVSRSKLLILGIIIYTTFNISALGPHWYDFFFFGSSIHHCCIGLDFYQVPNAAYALFHGGDLTGRLPNGIIQYSQNYMTNSNPYHPILTIVLGGFFILFSPDISINLWLVIKIFITLAAVYYIFREFKDNKYLNLALFLFLINPSQYNDIKISQYQFIFNIFLLFFLINLAKNKDKLNGGILLFFTLISKPISLLWIPILFIKRKYSVLCTGLFLFTISTLTFNILGLGRYFTDNILYHMLTPMQTKNIDFMSFEAILRNSFGFSMEAIKILKIIVLTTIYLISIPRRISIIKIIFLLILYFLFFYDLLFQYHFSVLGPLLCVCLLALPEFQTKLSRILIVITNLPNAFFIFRLFKIGIISNPALGTDPTFQTQQIISIFQFVPIITLVAVVLIPDMKYYLQILRKYVSR